VLIGAVIIGYGALLLADNLHWRPAYVILDRWYAPSVAILVGVVAFTTAAGFIGRLLGGFALAIGALWSAQNLYGSRLELVTFWPLGLVALGVILIARGWAAKGRSEGTSLPAGPTQASGLAFWSGIQRRIASASFSHAEFAAVMGGVDVDLRPSSTASGTAVIDVFVMMGGIVIRLPPDWTVSTQAVVVMGAIDDRSTGGQNAAHTLIIRGTVLMGGVDVRT
jgi:hypothetical protein